MRFASGNADKRGDVTPQLQQRVHLEGGLVPAELGPGEQREAQIDGGRVQSVETLIEIHADRIAGVQRPRDANQDLGEIGIDPPVAEAIKEIRNHFAAMQKVAEAGVQIQEIETDLFQPSFAVQIAARGKQP